MKRIFALILLSMANSGFGDDKTATQESVPGVTNDRPMSFWMAQKIVSSHASEQDVAAADWISDARGGISKVRLRRSWK